MTREGTHKYGEFSVLVGATIKALKQAAEMKH